MKTRAVLLLTFATMLPLLLTEQAQSKPKVHATQAKMAATYECPICHHKVNAAQAKELHYVCPVDHGKLVLVKTASLHKPHQQERKHN